MKNRPGSEISLSLTGIGYMCVGTVKFKFIGGVGMSGTVGMSYVGVVLSVPGVTKIKTCST